VDADHVDDLDPVVDAVADVVNRNLPPGPVRDALQGTWLGHPLHPLLTDLALGFWTSGFVLDFVPGKRFRPAADLMYLLGTVSAVPTVAAGLADWIELDRPRQRTGVVHAGANAVATGLYAWSLAARARGRRGRGVLLALGGATAATVGGYLGGHLAFPDGPVSPPPA
jgi:uncharacterized membrane protein